ncbi:MULTISPECIES: 2-hydroxyacid dehydrogenase [Marinomonas]|uniref:Glyoxylate/hydroxypyruvate reductase A n=1 Tax=Marinomonas rhodophyticola TaxID=2992803 RepID=A0ABT3KG57_9GAMM|nr:glyoxylate/hydroxypyruvate reductase A [Marinomonas sp. KJ51-3]MCW4629533.1 glyoxylate/hydroxypyruvate reductase A [Marinomonas sp. KJ51-3]
MIPFVSRIDSAEQAVWINQLSAAMPDEVILPFSALTLEQKQQCDVAIVANPNPDDLLALPSLKWVHSVWAGVERMINEQVSPTFSIVRLVDPTLSKTMSEAVLAWTLFLHRDMPAYAKQQSEGLWCPRPMVEAKNRRLGVLGLGELGRMSALRLVQNGFTVRGWSRQPKQIEGIECFSGEAGLIHLLQQTDILICLLPLTTLTKGLLNQKRLSSLPVGASIINFARGAIVDDKALLTLLDQGHLSHAVLDVFMQEPLPLEHSYWGHKSVTVLPHISAPTHPVSASQIVASNIQHYRLTDCIPSAVDPMRGY